MNILFSNEYLLHKMINNAYICIKISKLLDIMHIFVIILYKYSKYYNNYKV